jgi:ATP-dependent Clp protease ATP-binding subunit ClpC
VGARDIMQGRTLGFHGGESKKRFDKMQETIKDELGKVFNPEFLNRLDDVIVFHPLEKEHIAEIVKILLREVQRRLGDEVRLTQAALDFLVEKGFDKNYGARPLRRSIQRYIEDPLSERILLGELGRGDEIEVDVAPEGDKLAFRALTGSGSQA